jgi:hypothetical protein
MAHPSARRGGQTCKLNLKNADLKNADLKNAPGYLCLPAQALDLNLGGYDGIALCVKGDGQTYKLNLKTADQEDVPESTYQAMFDTVAGDSRFSAASLWRL